MHRYVGVMFFNIERNSSALYFANISNIITDVDGAGTDTFFMSLRGVGIIDNRHQVFGGFATDFVTGNV